MEALCQRWDAKLLTSVNSGRLLKHGLPYSCELNIVYVVLLVNMIDLT